jgi:opacity protein-like surface antigen
MHAPRPLLATLPLLAALLTATAATTASAAEPDNENRVQGKLRFHVDTDFFGWTQGREFREVPNPAPIQKVNQVGFGFARPLAGDGGIGGFNGLNGLVVASGRSMFGLGLGYGISRYLILGARMGMSFDHLSSPNTDPADPTRTTYNYFSTVFTPYLEILPLPRGRILPFILVRSGFQAASAGARTTGVDPILGDLSALNRSSTIAPTVGIGGGAHFLITERFSLDASLMFDYRWYFGRSRTQNNGGPTVTSDWQKSWQSFSLGAVVGFSVWFL